MFNAVHFRKCMGAQCVCVCVCSCSCSGHEAISFLNRICWGISPRGSEPFCFFFSIQSKYLFTHTSIHSTAMPMQHTYSVLPFYFEYATLTGPGGISFLELWRCNLCGNVGQSRSWYSNVKLNQFSTTNYRLDYNNILGIWNHSKTKREREKRNHIHSSIWCLARGSEANATEPLHLCRHFLGRWETLHELNGDFATSSMKC